VAAPPLILLVDDFDDALDIYATYLTHKGYRVDVARNGVEAIEKAEQDTPALILLDLRMPILDGAGALRRLRADPRFAATPIVALTAHALDEQRRAALEAGFDMVISKPCLPDDLVTAIAGVLGDLK
jgi:two-component system, cell cycle response regulator DivK